MSAPQSWVRDLSFIDEDDCAQLEAEILRREASGEEIDLSRFRKEGVDPLGTDWAWAGALQKTSTFSDQPAIVSSLEVRPRRFRRVGYALFAATAAGLLIALGMLLPGYLRNNGPESFALNVEPATIQFLGPQQPQPTVTSTNSGFISAIAITAKGEVNIWPTVGDRPGKPVSIRKGEVVRVGPMSADVEFIMVVVTEQPATLALIEVFGQSKIPPDQWPGMEQRITTALRNQNYRNLAVGRALYPPVP